MDHGGPALVFALALGIGVLCQIVARHLRMPSIVLLLFASAKCGGHLYRWKRAHHQRLHTWLANKGDLYTCGNQIVEHLAVENI